MSPPPVNIHDSFDAESDSDVSSLANEEEHLEGSIPKDDSDENGEAWENESESGEDEDDQPAEEITVPPLLPVPALLKKRNQSLCSTCKTLDLSPRRFVVLPGDPETGDEADGPGIDLGLIGDIKKKSSNCPFCRLVLAALGTKVPSVADDGTPVSVTISWNTDGPSEQHPQIRILRPYAQKKKGDYLNVPLVNFNPEITMLANDAPTPSKKSLFVRFIKDQIDFKMVRNWLSMCRIQHGSACDESKMLEHKVEDPARDIPYFRLIDVVKNCIVHAPSGCKYVALSYAWGAKINPNTILRTLLSNYKQLEEPGALLLPENHDRIPITIRDAMQVVKELNIRYMWVDSLCIIQDDVGAGGSKMSAISKMDLVYGAAYLTIWAATGIDANAGLPGVRPNTRRTPQSIEEVLPGLRLAFKPTSQDYIPDAYYYTRAWTYQERAFTKRSLVFTGGQIVYNCVKAEEWREDVLFEDQKPREKDAVDYDDNDIGEFEGLIQDYSNLSLTYNKDIYDAFAGMTRYFKNRLRVDLVHGIPDAFFDWFLLWNPPGIQKRREKTPSWSWSGWIGESWSHIWDWYTPSIIRVHSALRQRTWIIWYQRKAHDSEEVIRVWTPKKSSKPTSKPRNFYGSHVKDRFPIDCSRTSPTPRKLIGAPEYFEDTHNPTPGSGFLQFWTVSLVFKLGRSRSAAELGSVNPNTRFGIYGRSNRELGIVYLLPEWAKANIGKDHHFIILCEGRDKRAESDDKVDEEEGWRYKVMLIQWKGDWAERVSVGSIGKDDLDQSAYGPQWKEIILG